MDIVVGCIKEVVKYLVSPLTDHVSYLVHYKRNVNDLGNQMESLKALKVDIQRSRDAAHMRGEVIKVVVEDWLATVDQMQSKEMALKNTLEEIKGWLQDGCPARYKVGKDAKQMIDKAKELLNEGRTFDAVSIPAPLPPGLESMPTLDFHLYDSTKLAIDQIMKALKNEDKNMVGVYGIGGVGKTTLMKEVAKHLKNNGLFRQVVMVTVSQDPVLTKIQDEIAENLGLPLTQKSLSVRARLLLERLKKEEQILIVLDDLWKPLNLLDQIGIPYGNNCRVVLTTRQLEVCTQMETQVNIEVKVLSERDSWVLFKWAAGDCIEDDDMLRPMAKQIVKECGGLPLAIITIGRALRAKGRSEWEDAASQLKKSGSSPPDIEGVHEKVFCSIKLSYDYLPNDATKFCLLLCCMFPEDYSISVDDLLFYVVGEGVFGNTSSLREARNRLVTQMERLKRSCLLLDDTGGSRKVGNVRMHDIIRDVSIWIASKGGHNFVVESGRPLTNWPDEETLKKCKRLSLMQSNIIKLPDHGLDCHQLETLSLRDNDYLGEIPDGFFQGMTSLKTLDLGCTKISSIPSALACLTDLQGLCITGVSFYRGLRIQSFDELTLLGKLKKLEVLHLKNFEVVKLPEEIGEHTNLKWLRLSNIRNLIIAPNTLSKLSLMEELDLWGTGFREKEEEEACLSEVAYLSESSLNTLNIRISNIKCLCAIKIPVVRWENLTHFSVSLGHKELGKFTAEFDQCKKRVHISGSIPPLSDPERLIHLLELAEGLYFEYFCGLKYVISSLRARDTSNNSLRVLSILGCDDMEYILSTTTGSALNNNEAEDVDDDEDEVGNEEEKTQGIINSSSSTTVVLQLNNSSSSSSSSSSLLRRPTPIFCNLRILIIGYCDRLKHVLPMSLALQCLQQLEILDIFACTNLEEIIVKDIIDDDIIEEEKDAIMCKTVVLFPRLKLLRLCMLLNLTMVVSKGVQLSCHHQYYHWPSLEKLKVINCPNLKRLSMSLQTVTKLREIVINEEEWFNRLEWDVDDDDHDPTHHHEDKLLLHHLQERGVKVSVSQH